MTTDSLLSASASHDPPEPGGSSGREPIAIIGIGCRFPGGADDPRAFWKLLCEGTDAIREIPPDRWNLKRFYDARPDAPGKTNARWGGVIDDIDRFDASFFGISPREAALIDPQQRLLLEVTANALEDAGQPMERLSGTKTSVFVGISAFDYTGIQQGRSFLRRIDAHSNTGGAFSIAANRLSYFFDFRGPSMALDTACSSSLIAVHLGCQSLWRDESRLAVAGGVNVLIRPEPFIGFSRLSMLSPDGRCKAFDARANGFVRGEGAGVVILKPLSRALQDEDDIYAVIIATASNQDGHTSGLTNPSAEAQEELLRDAIQQAGITPAQVGYVEAHGTGTPVGDPIEAEALGRVLRTGRSPDSHCAIGSVKTNIGHLEPAAGIAGLIKVALSLKHGQIPPSLHFKDPNPSIDFDALKLCVRTSLGRWPENGGPAIAGVNSFGFGGANAHVVLRGPPPPERPGPGISEVADSSTEPCLFPFSARSPQALVAVARACRDYLIDQEPEARVPLRDVCWTASLRRSHHDHRLAIVASARAELLEGLESFARGDSLRSVSSGRVVVRHRPKLVFVCCGQGPQWWGMGRSLLSREPRFRETVERCDELIRERGNWSLIEELSRDESSSRLDHTAITQPAIFAIQLALADLWKSWGVEPDAVVGHSVGEVAAAYLSGALELADAVHVIFHRGRSVEFARPGGRMLAVALPAEETEALILGEHGRIEIAAINDPSSVTLSGDGDALERLAERLARDEIFHRFLRVSYAFHGPAMEPTREPLLQALETISPGRARLPLYSTVTGRPAEGNELVGDYWWRNVREPVRFAATVQALLADGYETFLELSPHPVLSGSILECGRGHEGSIAALASLRRGEDERRSLMSSLGTLFTLGHEVNFEAVCPEGRLVRLPNYPWQRERYWSESEESRQQRLAAPDHPLLGQRMSVPSPTWETEIDTRSLPYLSHHKVQGHVVLPATSFVEMAIAVARETLGPGRCVVEEMELEKACFVAEKDPTRLVVVSSTEESAFRIYSKPQGSEGPWTEHVRGRLRLLDAGIPARVGDIEQIRSRCSERLSGRECYLALREQGLEYGDSFQGIETLWRGDGEALSSIVVPEALESDLDEYRLHPAVLDACLQTVFGALRGTGDAGVYLPVSIGQVRVYGRTERRLWTHVRRVERGGNAVTADLDVYEVGGKLALSVRGLRCGSLGEVRGESLDGLVYEYAWKLEPRPGQASRYASEDLVSPTRIAEATRVWLSRPGAARFRLEHRKRFEGQLSALCATFIVNALTGLGMRFRLREVFRLPELAERLRIDPRYRSVLHRYVEILEQEGWVQRNGSEWEVRRHSESAAPREAWRHVLSIFPEHHALLALLGRTGFRLVEILRGRVEPAQLLFPSAADASRAAAEGLYEIAPFSRAVETLARHALSVALGELGDATALRILEIGGVAFGLSSAIAATLPADRTRCVYGHGSEPSLLKAKEKLSRYPFVECRILNIDEDPAGQGFEPHSFDVILASDTLGSTGGPRQVLENVKWLLAPEGLVLLLQTSNPGRWFDLTFRLEDGSSSSPLPEAELPPGCPSMTLPQLVSLLAELGFTESREVSGRTEEALEDALVLARGPRSVVEAPTAPPLSMKDGTTGTWLLLADRQGKAQKLADRLRTRGDRVVLVHRSDSYRRLDPFEVEVSSDSTEDIRSVVAELRALPPCRGIVHMWNLDSPFTDEATPESLDASMRLGCLSVIRLAQVVAEQGGAEMPRLWLVTRGVHALGRNPRGQQVAIAQAPVWGLGRVIANEVPKFRPVLVDLGPAAAEAEILSLCEELLLDGDEDEIALRDDARYVHRYLRASGVDGEERRRSCPGDEPFRLETSRLGTLDGLILRRSDRRMPAKGQVEIQVAAAGLNFSDVMKALGLYPGLPDGAVPLGIECSGEVTAVGMGVTGIEPGDLVVAVAPFSLGSFATTAAELVSPKPPDFGPEEAATLPIAFLTAHYALNHLGHLRSGERVLIHSASGGVGLAAIQLARRAGAEIFATAGSFEKRDFLASLGVEHVMDSRSLAFADEVLERTNGEGVDVVLNSLSGEAIRKGLGVLRDHGRFLEIGKRDIHMDRRLGLLPFRKNLSFTAVDLDQAMRERPGLVGPLFQEVVEEARRGNLSALPYRIFPVSNVVDGFRLLAQARHIGKVVVSMEESRVALAPRSARGTSFSPEGSYLISGGLGGFGLKVAEWMLDHGARHLILMGRSGAEGPGAAESVEALRRRGAHVVVAKADVSKPDQVASVLDAVAASMPPLRGIFHAAMVLEDCLVLGLSEEHMRKVWAPKVLGAWNLHTQSLSHSLDFFVLFSSISSIVGAAGQANYSSANAFLDSLAQYRKAMALPGLSVSWGALAEVGVVARHDEIRKRLDAMGLKSLVPRQALQLLGRFLQEDRTNVSAVDMDWARFADFLGRGSLTPRFAGLVEASRRGETSERSGSVSAMRAALLGAEPGERRERIKHLLREQVSRVLAAPEDRLDLERPLTELGIDSLMAVELRNSVEARLGVTLSSVELLRGPSLSELSDVVAKRLEGLEDADPSATSESPGDTEAIARGPEAPQEAPLSFAQERLWFLDQLSPGSTAYCETVAGRLMVSLSPGTLTQALNEVVRRHEILRTSFAAVEGRPHQRVTGALRLRMPVVDLTEVPPGLRDGEIQTIIAAQSRRRFDTTSAPLLRVTLIQLDEPVRREGYLLVVTFHHIIVDAWSVGVFLRELLTFYLVLSTGSPKHLPDLPIQYADFARWQRKRFERDALREELVYWREQLADLPELSLPTDRPRPAAQSFRGAAHDFEISEELESALLEAGQREGATLFMILLTTLLALAARYTGGRDLIVGSPVAGRNRAELSDLIGCFINMLVLRARLAPDPTFREMLQQARRLCLDGYAHQDVPFEHLVEELSPVRSLAREPLFQVVLAHHKDLPDAPRVGGLAYEPLRIDSRTSKYDLTIHTWKTQRTPGLLVSFQYSSDLFDAATIRRIALHFTAVLRSVAENLDRRLSELSMLTAGERHQLLFEWNATDAPYPSDTSISELFEAQVSLRPDASAVVFDGSWLSYGELNRRSNRLGRYLRRMGVGPDVRVALFLERSLDMVVGVVGIVKAGGAYVPLDPANPEERLSYMLKDAGARVVVSADDLAERLPEHDLTRVSLGRDCELIARERSDNLGSGAFADSRAYVMYTSGSTGRPKGASVTHRAISRTVINTNYSALTSSDRVAQATTASFDPSTFEIWATLLHGACLVGVSRETLLSPDALAVHLKEQGITVLHVTTALLHQLAGERPDVFTSVRDVLFGGEAVHAASLSEILEHGSPERLLDMYGPTETTAFATWQHVSRVREVAATIPIGRPVSNTEVYVLDECLNPAPIGVPGELHIGGPGLARDYLDRPELTAQKFIPHPHGAEGARLYRTGDRCRLLSDGRVEFLGRFDHQVKLRGHRVELGEVEAVLSAHPAVARAVVVATEAREGPHRLIAYWVPRGERGERTELRRFLERKLPGPMVPSDFIRLDQFPLTPNGKIDRKRLPAAEGASSLSERVHVAPRTVVEQVLARIWSEVLGVGRVGVSEDFFELGGHSLLATQVVSRVRAALHAELPLRAVFEVRTVAGLAEVITRARAAGPELPSIERAVRTREHPLSLAQQRLWFLEQLSPGRAAFHVPVAVRLEGPLRVRALRAALERVVQRHESLRTTIATVAGRGVQRIATEGSLRLPVVELAELEEKRRESEALGWARQESRRPFDLARGPLVRACLLRLGHDAHVLLLTVHHIVSDGWSMKLLFSELASLYDAFVEGKPSPLGEVAVQYVDYALWQRGWLRGELLDTQVGYWRDRLRELPVLELPTDRRRPPVQSFRGSRHSFSLTPELTSSLRALSLREGATMFTTLLAGFQIVLGRYSHQKDLAVGTPIANRRWAELEGTVGFFVNMLVMRSDLTGDPSFTEVLGRVQEAALEAFSHQDVPFEKLVEELQPARDLSREPLFQVVMTLDSSPTPRFGTARGVTMRLLDLANGTSKYDLTLYLREGEEELHGTFEYCTDLFDATTVERMGGHLERILEEMVLDPSLGVWQAPLLSEAERNQLLTEWNDTASDGSRAKHVADLVEAQAHRNPEAVAVTCGEEHLSYGALNRRANGLARRLTRLGVEWESRVVVSVSRSVELVISLLGVVKASAAYVPVDLSNPRERARQMVSDSGASLIVTEESLKAEFSGAGLRVVTVEGRAWADFGDDSNPPRMSTEWSPAYVMYTSGSTGRPKGVVVTHRGLWNLLDWHQREYAVSTEDRASLVAGISFDASVWELWPYLAFGASVHIADEITRHEPRALMEWLSRERITISFVPTPLAEAVLEEEWSGANGLRLLLTGGDQLHGRGSGGFRSPVVNHYGPTESTVVTTRAEVRNGDSPPPIGSPIANTRVYLLDREWGPVPVGVSGEIWVGGPSLARGYQGASQLTAERFVPSPFGIAPGDLLYRTGDLARWLPKGELQYLGRLDRQVKLRGIRVEPAEVEAVLKEHPMVRHAAVVARKEPNGAEHLWGYVVLERGEKDVALSSSALKAYLRARVPEAMVPLRILFMERLPSTPSGKVDRRALPEIASSRPRYVAPRTEAEHAIARVWTEVLGVDRLGVHESFFELGGDSILSIQVASRLRGRGVRPRHVFEHQTIAELAAVVGSREQGAEAELYTVTGPVTLTPIQHWFFEQGFAEPSHFNQSLLLEVDPGLSASNLREGVKALLRHHDALRLRFERVEGRWVQSVASPGRCTFATVDLSVLEDVKRKAVLDVAIDDLQACLDLGRPPMMSAAVFQLGAGPKLLLITIHHLAVDAVSWRVLLEDLTTGCEQRSLGRAISLPPKTTSFQRWAERLPEFARSGAVEEDIAYWRRESKVGSRALPLDRTEGENEVGSRDTVMVRLSAEETRALQRELPLTYRARIDDVLLTALVEAFGNWTGDRTLLVNLEAHGREELFEDLDLSRTVGWFTSLFPVLLRLDGTESALESIRAVEAQHRSVPRRGIGYGLCRYLRGDEELTAELGRLSPQVSFNYLGQLDHVLPRGGPLRLARDPSGRSQSPGDQREHLLDVVSGIWDGRLQTGWAYSRNRHERATIERLAAAFLRALRLLIECGRSEALATRR